MKHVYFLRNTIAMIENCFLPVVNEDLGEARYCTSNTESPNRPTDFVNFLFAYHISHVWPFYFVVHASGRSVSALNASGPEIDS